MSNSSASERVWSGLKKVASEAAKRRAPINRLIARAIVDVVIANEHASDIPNEARNFFAKELEHMVRRGAADGATSSSEP